MALTGLIPYLNFNGTASDAIALYERALGAKVVFLQRFGDTPEMGATDGHGQPCHARDAVRSAAIR